MTCDKIPRAILLPVNPIHRSLKPMIGIFVTTKPDPKGGCAEKKKRKKHHSDPCAIPFSTKRARKIEAQNHETDSKKRKCFEKKKN